MTVTYDPLAPDALADPFPHYAILRKEDPVHWMETFQCYALTRHADVRYALNHPEIFSSDRMLDPFFGDLKPAPGPWLIELDPPEHSRVRKTVSRAFNPRAVAAFTEDISGIVASLVNNARGREAFDLIEDLAKPLPTTTVAIMLGVGPEYRADFQRWSDQIVAAGWQPGDQSQRDRILASNQEFCDFFAAEIKKRSANPGADLLSRIVTAEQDEERITSQEAVALAAIVLMAGNETTERLIGNLIHNLLENPDQLALLRADHSLLPGAIDEALRFHSPLQGLYRTVAAEVEIGGRNLHLGEKVFVFIGSANRDPAVFHDPDRFDITRSTSDLLVFGSGIHFCLGAQLAKLEARLAMEKLLFDSPPFERVDSRPDWVLAPHLQGLKSLRLRWSA